jgi:hypothetical protein
MRRSQSRESADLTRRQHRERIMRIVLSILALIFLSINAYAQTPQIDHIDIVEYGIYTLSVEKTVQAAGAASGIEHIVNNVQHAETTRTVPAQVGVHFGFRYTVVGSPSGLVVPLHMITVFPSPGLQNPATQQVFAKSETDYNAKIGTPSYKGYSFTHDWETLPGIWTLQVWYQGREMVEQKFTVVKQ